MFATFLRHARKFAEAWIIAVTILFCTLVATLLSFLNGAIWLNFIASYSIGMTCMSLQLWVHKRRPESWSREWVTVITGIISLALGLLLGGTLGANEPLYFFQANPIGLVIGGIACIVAGFIILLMGHIRALEMERDAVRQQKLVRERELAIAQVQTLQAQIEPHFLFNTLANVQALIESEPTKAIELLESLTDLIRVSLDYSRRSNGSIEMESRLISNYLEVQKTRMGDRLSFNIEVQNGLKDVQLPPFLVQPLVENAIKHGIEPSAERGDIEIHVTSQRDMVVIEVTNTWHPELSSEGCSGVGIANVRKRLHAIYGDYARLCIEQSDKGRFTATLELPLEDASA